MRSSKIADGIDHEIEISWAVLKPGACRLEVMDDTTFQRNPRLV
jgi:hypothetical protein